MINQILAITIKEIKVLLRDRGAVFSLFLIPIAFILVMTVALQGLFASSSGNNNPVSVLIVNQDQGEIASKIITDLNSAGGIKLVTEYNNLPITKSQADSLIASRQYSIAIVFPENMTSSIMSAAGDPQAAKTTVSFVTDPAMGNQILLPIRGMVEGAIEREASTAQAPYLAKTSFQQIAMNAPKSQSAMIQQIGSQYASQMAGSLDATEQNLGVNFEVVAPASYHVVKYPTSVEQNVPAYTIYGVFFIVQIIAIAIYREKNEGTFRRLQASPITNMALLTGKLLPYYLVNLVQIASMFAVGVLMFHMNLGNSPLALILLSLAVSAAATGMGLLLAALTKTQEQAGSLGALLAIVLAAVGGMMVPREIMPQFMQTLSQFTPHAWALTGFQDVIVRGLGLQAVLPVVGILLAYAAAFWGVALWRFRFEN